MLEDILFEKDDLGRMALFDKLFKAIHTADRAHLVEEQRLKGLFVAVDHKISQLEFLHQNSQHRFTGLDEICGKLHEDIKAQATESVEWQNAFIVKHDQATAGLAAEMDDSRRREVKHGHQLRAAEQSVLGLETRERVQAGLLELHRTTLARHQDRLDELGQQKHDAVAFQ